MKFRPLGDRVVVRRVAEDQKNPGAVDDHGERIPPEVKAGNFVLFAQMVREAASKTNDAAGDGTTTAVKSNDEIGRVGTISANGDRAIGRMIAEAMMKAETAGVVAEHSKKDMAAGMPGGGMGGIDY